MMGDGRAGECATGSCCCCCSRPCARSGGRHEKGGGVRETNAFLPGGCAHRKGTAGGGPCRTPGHTVLTTDPTMNGALSSATGPQHYHSHRHRAAIPPPPCRPGTNMRPAALGTLPGYNGPTGQTISLFTRNNIGPHTGPALDRSVGCGITPGSASALSITYWH
ncbi:hypothetical protein CALCODRAFT_178517 [Calocera cornea HHB12733]|uniref:Uncharacterized protein n=1 Tax=Calocera cornea HHB12733 TaxID=1353952 RepID=A0A165CDY7_9BASI|nr:hypothetical protein CALCODRAFT_178517 [Calocera cornea HHB12733]